MTTTTIPERFILDEEKAREFIASCLVDYEADGVPEGDAIPLVEISTTWDPRQYDEAGTIGALCYEARGAGVLTLPADVLELAFDYSDDTDGGSYCWIVYVAGPDGNYVGALKLASWSHDAWKIADRDAIGADAALSILREAVSAGNGVLDDLAKYIEHKGSAS